MSIHPTSASSLESTSDSLQTFLGHMALEEEDHDWMIIGQYTDERIFLYMYLQGRKLEDIIDLLPQAATLKRERGDTVFQFFFDADVIDRYRRQFNRLAQTRIRRNREFIGILDFKEDVIHWSYIIEELLPDE